MLKIDKLKKWILKHKRPFSTIHIKKYGDNNYFSSADVRARELAALGFMRIIETGEARRRKLVKKGCVSIRWYELRLSK